MDLGLTGLDWDMLCQTQVVANENFVRLHPNTTHVLAVDKVHKANNAWPRFSLEFQAPAHGSHVHNNADLTVVALLSPPPSQLSSVHGPGSAELQFNRTWFRWRLQAVCHNVVNFTQHRGMALLDDSPLHIYDSVPGRVMRDCQGSHMHLNLTLDLCGPESRDCRHPQFPDLLWHSRTVHVIDLSLNAAYVVLSSISAITCLVLIWLHVGYAELRRFPNGMVFWRTICNLGFAVLFIWSNANTIHDASLWNICNPFVAFLTHFFLFASLGWFVALALNTYFSISNPFRKPSSRMPTYHALIWSGSLITATIACMDYQYRPDFQVCWIRRVEGTNPTTWVCMFAWMLGGMLVTAGVMIYAHLKLRVPGLKETLQKRQEILRQSRTYVIVFAVYWIVVGITWYVIVENTEPGGIIQERWVAFAFALLTSLAGMVDCSTWLYLQRVSLVRTIWGPRHAMARLLLSDLELWQARQLEALELYEIERGHLRPSGRYLKKHQPGPERSLPPPSALASPSSSPGSPLSVQLLDTGFFVAQDMVELGSGERLETRLAELLHNRAFDDISAALRQEFIVAVTEGILECSTVLFRRRRRTLPQHHLHHQQRTQSTPSPRLAAMKPSVGNPQTDPQQDQETPSAPDGSSLAVPQTSPFNHKLFAGARTMSVDSRDSDPADPHYQQLLDSAPESKSEAQVEGDTEMEDEDSLDQDNETLPNSGSLLSKLRRKVSQRGKSTVARGSGQSEDDDEDEQALPTPSDLVQYDPASLLGLPPISSAASVSAPPYHQELRQGNLKEPLLGGELSSSEGLTAAGDSDLSCGGGTYYAPDHLPAGMGKPIKIRAGNHEFRAFAPKVFRYLRQVWGWSGAAYTASMTSRPEDMIRNFSEGASGSFLWTTADQAFRPKTLDGEEFRTLLRLLPAYARHMARNPESLIIKIYGLYSIRMYSHTAYIMVMENVLRQSPACAPGPEPVYRVHEVFDLKGSWINRHAKPNRKDGVIRVFKDNDFKGVVRLDQARARRVRRQLLRDTRFLQLQGIMDYSLLLGIHNCAEPRQAVSHCGALQTSHFWPQPQPPVHKSTPPAPASSVAADQYAEGDEHKNIAPLHAAASENPAFLASATARTFDPLEYGHSAAYVYGPGIYHLAIIDVLQSWTLRKRVEQWLKRIFWGHWTDWEGISAVDPMRYQRRFMRMVNRVMPPDVLTADSKGMDWR